MNNSATSPPIWTAKAPLESWRQGGPETHKANNPAQIYWNVRTLWTSVWTVAKQWQTVWTDAKTWITLQPLSRFGWKRHCWKAGNERDLTPMTQTVQHKYIEMFKHFEPVFEQCLNTVPTNLKSVWTVFEPIWQVFEQCLNQFDKCLNSVPTNLKSVQTLLNSLEWCLCW